MAVISDKSFVGRAGIGVMVLAAGWWLMALHSSSQLPSAGGILPEDALQESSSAACDGIQGGIQEGIQGASACLPGASQAGQLARDESTGDTEGNTASAAGFDPADDASASGDIRYIDIYDPSTWPVDPNDSVDLGDVVPIDLYDPSTWPIEISTDDEPVDVEQIDLYDPDTWPSAEKSEAESASSAGGEVDVYDPATWPQTIGSAASGDAIVPIDPYDATTWPKE